MKLWPRLPLPRAKALVGDYGNRSLEDLQGTFATNASLKLFAPTGGVPIDDKTLRKLRLELESFAQECGYPETGSKKDRTHFDELVLHFLADLPIDFGEAIRPETWAWIAVVLAPHLVKWRWMGSDGHVSPERYAGPIVRNSFGRLWYQAMALDRGVDSANRWLYAEEFGADQTVALLERPSLAANRAVCLAVGKAWLALPPAHRKEELFRQTMKALIVRAGFQRFDVLESRALDQAVSDSFSVTMRRLRIS